MSLAAAAQRAATIIQEQPQGSRWFLDCDSDADGLCAAAVMAIALRRMGHRFQARASRDKTDAAYRELERETADGIIVLDKGTSHLDTLAKLGQTKGIPVLVIDHHNVVGSVPAGVCLVNPRAEGMDGSRDASAATTAQAVALALAPRNLDLSGIALAGAIGDWQHAGGWQGWNAEMLQNALAAQHLSERRMPALVGVDLAEAVARQMPGFATPEDARTWLSEVGIDTSLEAEELSGEQATLLLSHWARQLLAAGHGVEPDTLTRKLLVDARTGLGARHLFRIIDACGRLGDGATALAWLLGDRSARARAVERFTEYKLALANAMSQLRQDGTQMRACCQVAKTESAAFTGMVAGLGMTHALADRSVPVVVHAPRPDGLVQVSTRGSHALVDAGLDLGAAIAAAAASCGQEGGGHPIASGTVVRSDQLASLLDALDEELKAQDFMVQA